MKVYLPGMIRPEYRGTESIIVMRRGSSLAPLGAYGLESADFVKFTGARGDSDAVMERVYVGVNRDASIALSGLIAERLQGKGGLPGFDTKIVEPDFCGNGKLTCLVPESHR